MINYIILWINPSSFATNKLGEEKREKEISFVQTYSVKKANIRIN